jgi:hypothetical protein
MASYPVLDTEIWYFGNRATVAEDIVHPCSNIGYIEIIGS